jgi:hypothetical protein
MVFPQGSVLSPTLFNIALHDINKELDKNIKLSVYADDITVWTAHSEVQIANAQQAVNKTAAWTKKWGLKISREKTECCIFKTRHSLKNVEPDIILGVQQLNTTNTLKYKNFRTVLYEFAWAVQKPHL